jgi:hypothetical protein
VYAWDEDKAVGKKYNLSNCVVKAARRNNRDIELRNLKGPYDLYKACFNLCDLFNRSLHDKKWPFKRGGRNVMGEWGHQDNWAMTATLQNTFNCYRDVLGDAAPAYNFKDYCLVLADELFAASLYMLTFTPQL